jgi:hypothetical protein
VVGRIRVQRPRWAHFRKKRHCGFVHRRQAAFTNLRFRKTQAMRGTGFVHTLFCRKAVSLFAHSDYPVDEDKM